jgi:hypothetical protein
MAKDPIVESHIAESKAKIEKAAPETAETERHIDRTQRALERSRELLDVCRDPFHIAEATGDVAIGAVEGRPSAPGKARRAQGEAKRPG